jgi:SAM-dependent methyltransferase
VSIGGGRFSMGGQTASPGSLHLDMRKMNRVLELSVARKTIRVQCGIRWCDIQRFLDPHDLSVKIMQTYANFTVGGSLSVNVHGRYIGLGPLILSVRSIKLVLGNGDVIEATPTENSEVFYGAIGGYGGLGVLVEAELELEDNVRLERQHEKMPTRAYAEWFRKHVRDNPDVVFHNADLYAPHWSSCRAVSWVKTKRAVTTPVRLQPYRGAYPLERYFMWAVTETPLGKWRREFLVDPLLYMGRKVHFRNYEAGYDVAELEPPSRTHTTYVLQEYFAPVERFDELVARMREILQRHRVNMINISVRHALPDPGSMLAWAKTETFAFVCYYKQRTRQNARDRVAVWTRELIDAALAVGGSYYLPYQAHATPEQFHRAYPRARELFALKKKLDPDTRFRNVLWDKYYVGETMTNSSAQTSDFRAIYDDVVSQDAFYKFLQNIYHLYPEDRFHSLIKQACSENDGDEAIYRAVQSGLPGIKPFLADVRFGLPALFKQKQEMARQTLELLGDRRKIDGYLEIGSAGRYISELRKHVQLSGPLVLVNDVAPTNSPVDIAERGQLGKLGTFVPLNDYAPLPAPGDRTAPALRGGAIADQSMELVTCYIGLHHVPLEKLSPFLASIARVLKPGGIFILRDHDVKTPQMHHLVALAHSVFNAGLAVPWQVNAAELRYFVSVDEWVKRLAAYGLRDMGKRLLQAHDPTDNVLLGFVLERGGAA